MICATGSEAALPELAARLEAHDGLHEIRADLLATIDDALFDVVKQHAPRVLFCCRAARQGGSFGGSEADRLALIARAHARGARYLDVEDDAPLVGLEPERVVLSWHEHRALGPDAASQLVKKAAEMSARGTGVVKIAVQVDDAADLALLLRARPAIAQEAVLIGMGPAGLLSRVRYGAFGSAWTYAAASPARATAPGQLHLAAAADLGLPANAAAPFLALAGGEQVLRSPGPRVYNALFRARGAALSYLPLVTASLSRTLEVIERAGARGLSVTMPLKADALAACRADEVARAVGSVNSLRLADGGWEGTNTDVHGVRAPLERAALRPGATALILGAGGAARAAMRACRDLGLKVRVAARSDHGLSEVIRWEERTGVAHDVLVQATPLANAWPAHEPLRAAVVFDLALSPAAGDGPSLVERARAEGRTAIDALTMWIHQGAQQMTWMGVPTTAEELEALARSAG